MTGPYAAPRQVADLADCAFYHTMDIPGVGRVDGAWDLRHHTDAYLGHVDFRGKRVLEIGTASGFLCFEMERHGANVVACDLSDDLRWDVVPFARGGDPRRDERAQIIRRINNGFWLAHRAHGSSARMVYGTAYDVPEAIGPVDIAVFGCVLLHLRDPFLALQQGTRLATDTVIVVEPFGRLFALRRFLTWLRTAAAKLSPRFEIARRPAMRFIPSTDNPRLDDSWWMLSPEIVCAFLNVLGFPSTQVTFHTQRYKGQPIRMFTVVGRRTP